MSATAEILIQDLAQRGVLLTRHADRLRVEATAGTVTPELRLILSERKADLLAALSADPIRARLLKLAATELVDADLVDKLPEVEVLDCAELPDETLRAYLRGLRDVALRARGRRPADETAAASCHSCGPIWLNPSTVDVPPMTSGWPRLLGCPWCHVRNRRAIPRPSVTCGACWHFIRDAVNPRAGWGRCSAGVDPDRPTPMAARECARFRPSG